MHDRELPSDEAAPSGLALLEPDEIAALLADSTLDLRHEPSPLIAQTLRIELARARVPAATVAQWGRESVVAFDSPGASAVDVYVNERIAARGELIVQGGRWCVRIVELVNDVPRTTRKA